MSSVTLEDILQFSSGSIFVLKLDIQGFDCQALSDTDILIEWQSLIKFETQTKGSRILPFLVRIDLFITDKLFSCHYREEAETEKGLGESCLLSPCFSSYTNLM